MVPEYGFAQEPEGELLALWLGLLLNGNLLARFQRACVYRVVMTPGIASLNPGLMSEEPFRAAGLHAGGVRGDSLEQQAHPTTFAAKPIRPSCGCPLKRLNVHLHHLHKGLCDAFHFLRVLVLQELAQNRRNDLP